MFQQIKLSFAHSQFASSTHNLSWGVWGNTITVVSPHHPAKKNVGACLISTSEFFFLLSDFYRFSCSWLFHNSPEFKNLFLGGPVIETDPDEHGPTEVNAYIQLKNFVWQWHNYCHHLTGIMPTWKPNCGIYLLDGIMIDQSIKEDVTLK